MHPRGDTHSAPRTALGEFYDAGPGDGGDALLLDEGRHLLVALVADGRPRGKQPSIQVKRRDPFCLQDD